MPAIAIKERPILMHARSIRGILEGRKTQTRRIVKLTTDPGRYQYAEPISIGWRLAPVQINGQQYSIGHCPYGQPGDRLWVRETFYVDSLEWIGKRLPSKRPFALPDEHLFYRADGECCDQISECCCAEVGKPKWRSSIHMPRWACRLVLEITGIRVERVQDISANDVLAEGVQVPVSADSRRPLLCISRTVPSHKLWRDHKNATADDWFTGYFALLWDETNGEGAWDRNDWVWVLTFRKDAR